NRAAADANENRHRQVSTSPCSRMHQLSWEPPAFLVSRGNYKIAMPRLPQRAATIAKTFAGMPARLVCHWTRRAVRPCGDPCHDISRIRDAPAKTCILLPDHDSRQEPANATCKNSGAGAPGFASVLPNQRAAAVD